MRKQRVTGDGSGQQLPMVEARIRTSPLWTRLLPNPSLHPRKCHTCSALQHHTQCSAGHPIRFHMALPCPTSCLYAHPGTRQAPLVLCHHLFQLRVAGDVCGAAVPPAQQHTQHMQHKQHMQHVLQHRTADSSLRSQAAWLALLCCTYMQL
jgi:hypothetical protein